jgi:hypothetical protein
MYDERNTAATLMPHGATAAHRRAGCSGCCLARHVRANRQLLVTKQNLSATFMLLLSHMLLSLWKAVLVSAQVHSDSHYSSC